MTYIPRKGPWEEIPASDHSKATPEPATSDRRVPNSQHQLGAGFLVDRLGPFKYERRITNLADYLKQKTIINANMWTPKQLFTTQTFFFCSTGDEERMGGAILEGDTRNDDLFLGTEGKEFPEWEVILGALATAVLSRFRPA